MQWTLRSCDFQMAAEHGIGGHGAYLATLIDRSHVKNEIFTLNYSPNTILLTSDLNDTLARILLLEI